MNVHISYKIRKTPEIEKEINHQVEKLRRRLQVFRPELVHLKGILEENTPREGTTVSFNLRLPSGQLAVQKSGPQATTAVKGAFEDLLQQITKHKELLRSSHKWRRRGAPSNGRDTGVPFEETLAAVHPATVSPDDVRMYVNANLNRLERFVERELLFRESSEQLPEDAITTREVVDEVIVAALSDGEKPEKVSLEPWLYRLALRAINDFANSSNDPERSVHLEDSARKRNVRGSDEPELQFHQPDEMLNEENVIADRRTATPEQAYYSEEINTLVESAMAGLSPTEREVFVLYGVEGFSIDEVAVIVDREKGEVLALVSAAREHMRKSPALALEFRDKLLSKSSV
jgi:RNA polymerase sigma factor (sigma-70 family)